MKTAFTKLTPANRPKRLLVVDLCSRRIALAEPNSRQDNPYAQKLESLGEIDSSSAACSTKTAQAVADACAKHHITAREVVLLLPRSGVALKTLKIPPCPTAERATLVHMAVAGRSSVAIEELCVGFVCPDTTADVSNEVLVATMPKRLADTWQAAFASLGFALTSIGLHGLAISSAFLSHGVDNGIAVYVNQQDCLAVSLVNGRPVAVAECELDLLGDHTEQAATIVRRLLLQHKKNTDSISVRVASLNAHEFASDLQKHFDGSCDVQPLELAVDLEAMAAIGWHLGVANSQALDLLKPTFESPQPKQLTRARIAIAATLLVLLGFAWHDRSMAALDDQIDQLKRQHKLLTDRINQAEPLTKSVVNIEKWTKAQASWLDTFQGLVDKWPETKVAYVNQMRFETLDGNGHALVRMTGQATDTAAIARFQNSLMADPSRYKLVPHGIRPGSENPDYPVYFDVEVQLNERTTSAKR